LCFLFICVLYSFPIHSFMYLFIYLPLYFESSSSWRQSYAEKVQFFFIFTLFDLCCTSVYLFNLFFTKLFVDVFIDLFIYSFIYWFVYILPDFNSFSSWRQSHAIKCTFWFNLLHHLFMSFVYLFIVFIFHTFMYVCIYVRICVFLFSFLIYVFIYLFIYLNSSSSWGQSHVD